MEGGGPARSNVQIPTQCVWRRASGSPRGVESSGPEVDSLRTALEKARKLSAEPAVEIQITECKGFITRAEKWVAEFSEFWSWRLWHARVRMRPVPARPAGPRIGQRRCSSCEGR